MASEQADSTRRARTNVLRGEHYGTVITRAAERWPTRAAAVDGPVRLSFADLDRESARLANGLATRLGVRRGDVVAVQLPNSVPHLLLHLAVARLGAVLATIHVPYREREVQAILGLSRARVLVTDDDGEHLRIARESLRASDHLERVVIVGSSQPDLLALEGLFVDPPADWSPELSPSDPFVMAFTSGTEGRPKGCVLTHDQLLSNTWWCNEGYPLGDDDVVLSSSAFTHMFGISSIPCALQAGATQVMLRRADPERFLELVEEHGVTFAMAVPAQILQIAAIARERGTPTSLRRLVTGGQRVHELLVREARAALKDCLIQTQWGMTEIAGGCITRGDDPQEKAWQSVGRPLPGSEARVVDDLGAPVQPGAEGELHFRSPYMIHDYLGDPAASAHAFLPGGWFRTGDLATIDADGYVAIVGRAKDIVNRGGMKLNPIETEELLLAHPGVRQVAVVAMPDSRLGEKSCAYVSPQPGAAVTLPVLASFLLDRGIAKFKLPERLELREELPMTATRKVQKGALRTEIEALASQAVSGWKVVGFDFTDTFDGQTRWEVGTEVRVTDPGGVEIHADPTRVMDSLARSAWPVRLLRVEAPAAEVVQHGLGTTRVRAARVLGEEPVALAFGPQGERVVMLCRRLAMAEWFSRLGEADDVIVQRLHEHLRLLGLATGRVQTWRIEEVRQITDPRGWRRDWGDACEAVRDELRAVAEEHGRTPMLRSAADLAAELASSASREGAAAALGDAESLVLAASGAAIYAAGLGASWEAVADLLDRPNPFDPLIAVFEAGHWAIDNVAVV